jgi:OmcA/MtrC family decaheme c-type cytochrome
MCHTTDVVDPDTGNSVDMPEMIHKIHMGENLPSVQAGQPYQIIGFRQSVHDYSHVVYPMDVRNCESCHTDGATEHEAWFTRPDRDSCGSCHDDVNFVTGENHVNLPQISDRFCANCHFPQGELEYDGSIIGSHTVPSKSTQLAGINIQITDVSNAGPGMAPTVHFTMNNNAGETIQPGDLPFFNLVIAGPNEDYSFLASEPGRDAVIDGDGFAYTFNQTLPEDAVGSYTVGAEGFRSATLNAGTVRAFDIRESPVVEVFPFAVTDAEAMPRRQIVSEEKCSNCHDQLSAHGTFRHNTEYCVTCHQPMADDAPFRPDDQFPAQSIDFKYMIHKIHMGEELSRDYTVIGFMGNPANYNEVLYPGYVANCEGCHVNDSYAVPSGGVLETPTPYDFFSPTPPNSTACLSCHDGLGAAAHAFTNISPFDESCGTCHGSGAEFDVARIHAH